MSIVSRIEKVISEVEREHGPLTFAALVQPDDSDDPQYDLVVSSPWFLHEGKFRSYEYLTVKLKKHLLPEDWPRINRLQLLPPSDEFIQDLTHWASLYKVRDLINIRMGRSATDLRSAHIYVVQPKTGVTHLRSFS